MGRLNLLGVVVIGVMLSAAPPASPAAPPAPGPGPSATSSLPPPVDELGRGTPQDSVRGFLEATTLRNYKRASNYLDLRRIPAGERATRGPELAHQLRVVLDNTVFDLGTLSDDPEGRPETGLPKSRQLVGRVETDKGTFSVLLDRVPRDDGVPIWQFSNVIVAQTSDLYRELSYGIVGERLPTFLVETRLFRLALWQWIGLFLLLGLSYLIAWVTVRPGLPLTRRILDRAGFDVSDPTFGRAISPLRGLVGLGIFKAGESSLALPATVHPLVVGVQKFVLVIIMSWLALRLIEVSSHLVRRRLLRRHEPPNQPVVDFIQRGLKIVVSVLAALMLLEAVGVQVSALIAAIGVGGIGIALAAQRTVENLFGGLAVVGDRPVQEGDFCKFGDQQGTVERIGLWSTRLRTPERSVITIPNAQFLTARVENLQERDRILFNTIVRLRYETTPDQVRWVLVRVRALLDAHPRVDPDTSRARFSGFGASSLDIELFVYVRTRDNLEFLAVREDLCLRIMDIVTAAGTALALPAQANYAAAAGLDAERAGAASAEVQRWRTEGKLSLPEFPLKTPTA
ncbi:MAG TPA: mechanosensitive ion channel family protein [Methylomirabilota bacterium]